MDPDPLPSSANDDETKVERLLPTRAPAPSSSSLYVWEWLRLPAPETVQQWPSLVEKVGLDFLRQWRTEGRHSHSLIHELVVQEHGFDVNAVRESDGCTPLHLAIWNNKPWMEEVLRSLGAREDIVNKHGEDVEHLRQKAFQKETMVWLDMELTHLPAEGPCHEAILELAVTLTDERLNPLVERHWVLHREREQLKQLSPWHQLYFSQPGYLFDECVQSTLTTQQVETEFLSLLKQHVPEKCARLAGLSVHVDRYVLLQAMPSVYNYCHHQVLDVSTLYNCVRLWRPDIMPPRLPPAERNALLHTNQAHRAPHDVQRALTMMKWFREHLFLTSLLSETVGKADLKLQ